MSWNLDLNIIASGSEDQYVYLWKLAGDSTSFNSFLLDKFVGPVWRV